MRKNKKAAVPVWSISLVIMTLIVLTTATIYLNVKVRSVPRVGESQQQVFETAVIAERALLFLDSAAFLSARQAVIDAAFDGGYISDQEEENCGIYLGFNMWTTEGAECYPGSENIKRTLTYYTDANLRKYVYGYEEVDLSAEYRYAIISPMIIVGGAVENIQMPIKQLVKEVKLPVIGVPLYEELIIQKYEVPASGKEMVKKIYENYGDLLGKASNMHGVPEELLGGVIAQESKGNPYAVSPTGCKGIAQFCAPTAYQYGLCDCVGPDCGREGRNKKYCVNQDDRFDYEKSIDAEGKYYKYLLGRFVNYNDQEKFAIASYNAGEGVIKSAIRKTGKQDPSWEEVSAHLTPDLITYFRKDTEKANKVKEVKTYVARVTGYKEVYEVTALG